MIPLRVLIVPDKFKGTFSAAAAARVLARGWRAVQPTDQLDLVPMSDGGEGFGEILARLLGARTQRVRTVDAAHLPLTATWWWEPRSRTAIIESACVVGLARLPHGQFHPFDLDTFGLGAVLSAAARKGAQHCLIGLGGSATNDGGFGLARALGWRFLRRGGREIQSWPDLAQLIAITPPGTRGLFPEVTVAVDVQNPLLGPRGCTRIFGPQKGLRPQEFDKAEAALRRLAAVVKRTSKKDLAGVRGAGAAGGLGFGLMAFAGATSEPGFDLFARHADLRELIRRADVVLTGEGTLDVSTLMGKGVGEVAKWCRELDKPCYGIGGQASNRARLRRRFAGIWAAADFATANQAMKQASRWLAVAARAAASESR